MEIIMKSGFAKFFSLNFWQQVFEAFLSTCQRFPLAILSLIVFTLLAYLENHNIDLLTDLQWGRGMLIAAAGAFWFLASGLFAESHGWTKIKKYSFALPIFAIIFWQISSNDSLAVSSWTLILTVGLAVSFAAYIFRQNDNASIWYFNFQLATGICFAVLSVLILSGGLSLVLKSVEYLFEINISHKFYMDIWLTAWCFFAPAYFLTNVPTQFDYQRSDCDFPRGVHFIQNYVLVPLSIIFMVILYAYFIKILLQWELPRGNLGKMISTFGVIGIFTHLTIYPVHDRGAPLLNWFYRNFYKMMIVPLGLLILAITVRISEYGLTEPRYIVVISVIWFALLIVYYLIKGTSFQIRNVVIVLATLSLIASFGPWRIDKLPVQDQFARLQKLLIKEKLLISDQYKAPKFQPDFETRKSISSIVSYLVSHGGSGKMRPWFSDQTAFEDTIDCGDRRCRYYDGSELVKLMEIDYVDRWMHSGEGSSFYINLKTMNNNGPYGNHKRRISVKGFDYMVQVTVYQSNCVGKCDDEISHAIKTDEIKTILKKDNKLEIISDDSHTLSFDLNKILDQFHEQGNIELPPEDAHKLVLDQSTEGIKARLLINHIHGVIINDKKQTQNMDGVLLLKINGEE